MAQMDIEDQITILNSELDIKKPLLPYGCVAIHTDLKQYLYGLSKSFFVKEKDLYYYNDRIEEIFVQDPKRDQVLVTISVRTAFDLFFQYAKLPRGSEVIMTAINIPHMVQIVRAHGYIPIPVDLQLETMSPAFENVKSLVTERTRAIVISYLFGIKYNIDPIIDFCKVRGIYIIEDAAEAYSGPRYNGNPRADMTFFSFGSIKFDTAFGGGITIIKNNPEMYKEVKRIHETYIRQTKKE